MARQSEGALAGTVCVFIDIDHHLNFADGVGLEADGLGGDERPCTRAEASAGRNGKRPIQVKRGVSGVRDLNPGQGARTGKEHIVLTKESGTGRRFRLHFDHDDG